MTFKSQKQNLNLLIKKCYELYFGSKLGDQDKSRASQYEKYNWNICGDLKFTALWLAGRLATQNYVAFCVSGVIGTENIITSENSNLKETRLFQDIKT
jgi:hypothetical protein